MSSQIQTIEELEFLYYTNKGIGFLEQGDINSPFINKTDAPVTTSTTGVYNPIYGAQAWVQFNQEANTFGVQPKTVHRRSGWRVISARAVTRPYGGQSETATLPDTKKPTFAQVSTKPKLMAVTFGNTEIQEFLAQADHDDAIGDMHELRMYFAGEHREDINAALNVENGTAASNNFESMDRVFGSYDERTNAKKSDESTSYSANDLDIYGLDRDGGATYADAYVNHNSGTVRSLTDSLLQSLFSNTLQNGANTGGQYIQTGYDTWSTVNQLYDAQIRYNVLGETTIKPGVNGIETAVEGRGVGMAVAKYLHAPVIQSKDTVVDTGGVSRIYLADISNPEGFDLPRLSIRVAKPTQYFEAGMNQGNPFVVNQFGTKGLYRTMAEEICTFFKVQGKLRDLKA